MRGAAVKFGHVAGDALLDLLNTVEWRLGRAPSERLVTFDDLLDWGVESDLVSEDEAQELRRRARREPALAERERSAVADLRELAYRALWVGDRHAAAALAHAYAGAVRTATLTRTDDHWRWSDDDLDLDSPRHRITRGLVDLARRSDLDRLRQCADARCGWVYLDTSPRRNRRWCNAKDCGDRNRARTYYARKKASTQPS